MLNVSFYLVTPDAKTKSQVYVSISRIKQSGKGERLRFPVDAAFKTSYCNNRDRGTKDNPKKRKELVKRNSVMFNEYKAILANIEKSLLAIFTDLEKAGHCTLEAVKETYFKQVGWVKDETKLTFEEAWTAFLKSSHWADNTRKKFDACFNHLKEFEKTFGAITPDKLNEGFWKEVRDEYFVKVKQFSNNSSNKYLTGFKQFLRYAKDKNIIKHDIKFESLEYLDEVEPFRIALKEHEIDTFINLDLSKSPKLDLTRDLFLLQFMCGQRHSDLYKIVDKKHLIEQGIQFYQQKTDNKATVPLHKKLKVQLEYIAKKYPEGLPVISLTTYNADIKEVAKLAGLNSQHSWHKKIGKQKKIEIDFRYNLVTTHTARRSFATIARKRNIKDEEIMKVGGWKDYKQYRQYIQVDESDVAEAFEKF